MTLKKLFIGLSIGLFLGACSTPTIPEKTNKTPSNNTNFPTAECDNPSKRFKEDIFPELTLHQNIKYSRNTTMQNQTVDLKMDIFEPQYDSTQGRPLVIWAHGGYFCFGDKSNFHDVCQFLSRKGWVTASIDYRKWRKRSLPDSLEYMETAIRATHDLHAAIQFFKEDAAHDDEYGIDTNRIFIGGYSAGGIMAAQVAYLNRLDEVPAHFKTLLTKNGGLRGNDNYQHSSEVAGTIVIAGGLYSTQMLADGSTIPFLGIQGTQDDVVPYRHSWAYSPMGTPVLQMSGTAAMHKVNEEKGIPSTLVSLPRGDHNAPWDPLWLERTMGSIHKFLLKHSCE